MFFDKGKEKEAAAKKVVTFGDSVTWYDGKPANPRFTQHSMIVGYQSHVRKALGWKVTNKGVSGDTTQQICERSLKFDYRDYDLAIFFAGINNLRDDPDQHYGELQPIGGPFDRGTFCGAYQKMVEDVIQRSPETKLLLIVPYKCWSGEHGLLPPKFRDTILAIGILYGIPVLNLYDNLQFNELNREVFFADDPAKQPWFFHLNDLGYQWLADLLIPCLKNMYE